MSDKTDRSTRTPRFSYCRARRWTRECLKPDPDQANKHRQIRMNNLVMESTRDAAPRSLNRAVHLCLFALVCLVWIRALSAPELTIRDFACSHISILAHDTKPCTIFLSLSFSPFLKKSLRISDGPFRGVISSNPFGQTSSLFLLSPLL